MKYQTTKLKYLFISAIIFFISCNQQPPAEHYGFLTMLGNDTISLESITNQGNTITSDEVDRFPIVRVRHTVINLDTNGSIKHLEMDIHTPAEASKQRECKVIADVANNKVHISKTDSTGTFNRDFATGGSIIVAHVPQMYSLYELYFAAAMKHTAALKLAAGTPVQMRQFYIDREFDHFPLGDVTVTPLSKTKAEIQHDWLSGTGEATMDSNYHLLSYSGARTTYKENVIRLATPPDVKSIASRFETLETTKGAAREISARDTMRAQIGNAMFTVAYGRPLLRGRILLGNIIPYDRVWRTGANAATQFTTSAPIKLAGKNVPAGSYTLWTAPHTNSVDLIVNKQTGQWGTEYDGSQNLWVAKMLLETNSTQVEKFTISIVQGEDAKHGTLVMEWGSFKWSAPVEVE